MHTLRSVFALFCLIALSACSPRKEATAPTNPQPAPPPSIAEQGPALSEAIPAPTAPLPVNMGNVVLLAQITWGDLPGGISSSLAQAQGAEAPPAETPIRVGLTSEPQLSAFLAIPLRVTNGWGQETGIAPAPWGSLYRDTDWVILSELEPASALEVWGNVQPYEETPPPTATKWDGQALLEWMQLPLLSMVASDLQLKEGTIHVNLLQPVTTDPTAPSPVMGGHTYTSWENTGAGILQLEKLPVKPEWITRMLKWNQRLVTERGKDPLATIRELAQKGTFNQSSQGIQIAVTAEDTQALSKAVATLLIGAGARLQAAGDELGYTGVWQDRPLRILGGPQHLLLQWGNTLSDPSSSPHWRISISGGHPRLQKLSAVLQNPLSNLMYLEMDPSEETPQLRIRP